MLQFIELILYLSLAVHLASSKEHPPSFKDNVSISPSDSIGVISEGNTVTFNCKADGSGPLTYSYISTNFNGISRNLDADPRYKTYSDGRLVISNSHHAKDDGYYFCVAKNSFGTALSKRATLHVAYLTVPVSAGSYAKDAIQYTGFTYTYSLTDTFPGYPKTSYIFTHNGLSLLENERISVSDTGNIYIANVQMSDLGTYKSVVKNAVTLTQYTRPDLSLRLKHAVKPSSVLSTILLGPSDKIAIHNKQQSVTFECFATGLPMPTITWKKNNQAISSNSKYEIKDFNKRMTVKNILSSDQGTYSCHVSNPKSEGAGSRTATLIVQVEPSWSKKPANATAKVLNSVTFSCLATGSPMPKYTWYHNGEMIVQGKSARKSINANNNDLTISSIVDDDRGVVQCVAANDAGYLIGTARLTVDGVPVWIDVPPSDRTALLGETIELTCQARGSVTPTMNWQKDGAYIGFYVSGSRFHLKISGNLQITNVKRSDSGVYTCIATTPGGYKNASATLKVLSQTNITKPLPSTMTAIKGYPTTLNVGITHDKQVPVTITWTKDGSIIIDQRLTVLANGSLYISRVQDSDAGIYKCFVYSKLGNGTTSGRLVVQETPLSPSRPVVVSIQSNSVRLTWNPPGYDGNSPITSYNVEYQKEYESWKLALQNINPSSKDVSAVVTGLKPYTRYKFRVRAVNSVGVGIPSDATAFITTYAAPPSQAPTNVIGTPASAESILVQWKAPPPESHNGVLTGFRIAYRQSGIQSNSFSIVQVTDGSATQGTVTALLRWTEYAIKVQAYNSAGSGPFSTQVLVMTGEGAPGAPVQNLKIIKINPSSVELQWEPPPQKQWNGNLKRYLLRAWEPSTPKTFTEQSINHDSSKSLQQGTLLNLKKYTQYEIVVVAVNGAGAGPPSTKLLVKTDQGIPDAVSSMSISEVYSDGFRVSWSRPSQVNGQLVAYVIETWQNGSKAATLTTHKTPHDTLAYVTTGLKPRTGYFVTVAAETQAGKGTSKMLSVKTVDSPVPPSAPSKPEIVEARAWEIRIRWTPGSSGRAPIVEYKIQYNNDSFYDPVTAKWKLGLRVTDAHRVYQLFPLIVPGMRPNVGYRFRVIAINVAGSSPPSTVSDKVMTLETAPSLPPSDVTVHSQANAGAIEIRWKIPPKESWNSDSIGYKIDCVPSSSPQHTHSLTIPNPYTSSYTVGGLLMYTKYKISITSYNLNGKGVSNTTEVTYTTSEGAPVTPPTNVKTKVLSATTIELSWGPLSAVGRNGEILGYKIFNRVAGQAMETVTRVEGGSIYSYILSNLESFVVYEFEILAYTRLGVGPKSSTVRARTFESAPGPPSQVRFSYIEKDSVKMHWNPPIYPHGNITGYRVAYRRNQSTGYFLYDGIVPASREAEVFLGLHRHTFYRFFVWAKTKQGWGPSAEQVVYTTSDKGFPPDTPFIFPIPTESIRERSVEIEWRINEYPSSPYRYFTLQFQGNSGGWSYYSRNLNAKLRKLKVEGLLPGTNYKFRIMATNDLGDSPYSTVSHEVTTNPTIPTGAPRDVRIRAESPSTLQVEWTAPNPEEIGGTLKGFIIKYKKKGTSFFNEPPQLAYNARRYTITGLEVFTTYLIVIAVVNEKGTGRFTPELPGTTGELAPGKGPTKVEPSSVTKTSLIIKWQAPSLSSINGYLQGFKVYFKGELSTRRRRRRRRRSLESCELSDIPSFVEVDRHKTEVTIRNLRKYVTYSIWVRAYNSKGVSPSSEVVKATTKADVPGPLTRFGADSVFNDRINLSWKKPCDPNGIPEAYEITFYKTTSSIKSKVTVQPDKTSYVITDLDMLTEYMFEIRFKNHIDFGPSLSFIAKTKGPAVLPGQPGKPSVRASSTTAILSWKNGHSGNVPFLKFEIQSRIPGQGDFKTEWTILPKDLQINKTFVSCTVGNLKPQTSYQFRIIAWNKVGHSKPSPPSDISTTSYGALPPPQPLHQETWFISVTAVLAVILVVVVIGIIFICMRRRKESLGDRLSTTGSSNRNTLELKDQRQSSTAGSIPGLHIAYRDPNEEIAEVSSLGSKDGMSEIDGASGGENYLDKDPNKLKFVDHYAHDPKHESWRTTFDNQDDAAKAKYDEYTSQVVALPDDFQKPRFKSFSSLEGKDFPVPPPPAYESHPEDDVDHCYAELPSEAVTSFMSPEYEAKKTRSLGRPRSAMTRHAPSDSDEDLERRPRRGYGSQSQIDQFSPRKSRDDLRQPHRGSREHFDPSYHRKPRTDGYSYATMPHPRHLKQNDIYQNLPHIASGHEADVSSEMSSSSNGDQRTPGRYPLRGAKPPRYPKPEYLKDPARRRNRPPNLNMPPSKYPDHSTSSDSPTSPISPAPSYHSNDEYDPSRYRTSLSRIPPPREYADAREPEPIYHNTLPRQIEPRVVVRNGRSREHFDDNEVHISPYQSFV